MWTLAGLTPSGPRPAARLCLAGRPATQPDGFRVRRTGVDGITDIARPIDLSRVSPDAFAEWVRPEIPVMTRVAARLAPTADRDDIVQEALVRAWQKRGLYDSRRGTPAAWLAAITADRARRAWRNARPTEALLEIPARIRSTEDRLDLEHALSGLPHRQRLAIDCYYFIGLSVAETAVVMRCAEGTVKSTLFDGRSRLKSLLEGNDGRD